MSDDPKYIGTATMRPDETVIIRLYLEDGSGAVGQGEVSYPPGHAKYRQVLTHIGEIKPGETRLVPEWPAE